MKRECGDCQLCCRLLPVPPLGKGAGERCKHQSFAKGCTVYHRPGMPPECWLWNCRWLVNDDCDELSRPDRAHYVIDIVPDFVTINYDETGEQQNIQVAQVWIDPKYPEAHRDPALRRWMVRRAEQGIATMIRFNAREALTIFPPPFDAHGEWHEIKGGQSVPTHTFNEMVQALGGEVRAVIDHGEEDISRDPDRSGNAPDRNAGDRGLERRDAQAGRRGDTRQFRARGV